MARLNHAAKLTDKSYMKMSNIDCSSVNGAQ